MLSKQHNLLGGAAFTIVAVSVASLHLVSARPATACEPQQGDDCGTGPDGWEKVQWAEVCSTVGTCGPTSQCSGDGGTWTIYDSGGNVLKIECATASCDPDLDAFKYYYNSVLVGECRYELGKNIWLYKKDADGSFACVKQRTRDDGCCATWSSTCHDDDCDNEMDWMVFSYSVGGSVQPHPRQGSCANFPSGGWENDGAGSEPDCGPTCGG